MKKILFLLAFLFVGFLSFGQTFQWAKQMGGSNYESGVSIASDKSSSILTLGFYAATADLDPSPSQQNFTSVGMRDIFINKMDSSGNQLWTRTLGSVGDDQPYAVTADDSNNVISVGSYVDTLDFDPSSAVFNIPCIGSSNSFVNKLDPNGNFMWSVGVASGNTSYNRAKSVAVDTLGNIYVLGEFGDTVLFNTTPSYFTSNGGNNLYILKLNPAGNTLWAKKIGGGSMAGNCINIDKQQNIVINGNFNNTVDFDPSSNSFNLTATNANVFVAKYTNGGNFIWAKQMVSNGVSVSSISRIDNNNNILTTGFFSGTCDFDPGVNNTIFSTFGLSDIFVTKLDENGNSIWARQIGGSADQYGNGLDVDSLGNVYATGWFYGTVDFDPSPLTQYLIAAQGLSTNAYIFKLDSLGNFTMAYKIQGINTVEGNAIKTIGSNAHYTGRFYYAPVSAGVDFDPTPATSYLQSFGGNDAYIAKVDICSQNYYTNQSACDSLVYNGTTYYGDTVLQTTYGLPAGCDSNSIVVINITHPIIISLTQFACDSFVLNNQVYYTTGTYNQVYTSTSGCDSTIVLNLTVNHSTTNSFNQTGCDSLLINNQTFTTSGIYSQILMNSQGCDSNLTLNLTINNSTTNSITHTACNSYTLNGQTYTSTGIYSQMFVNSQGCDSTLTLNLTINSATASATANGLLLTASPSGATYQWIKCNPYTIIAGETNQTYTVTANGDYAVVVTQNGCSDTSNCITFTNVGVNEIELAGITVYPNPSTGTFVLSSTNNLENASLKVLNSLGQVVYQKNKMSGNEFQINLADKAVGIYTLEMSEGDKVSRLKLMKR